MTYSSGGLIQATDYNTFKDTLNGIWSTGTGNSGYGQTAVAAVTSAGTVTATQWATLNSTLTSMARHSNTTITSQPTSASSPNSTQPGTKLDNTKGVMMSGTSSWWLNFATNTWTSGGFNPVTSQSFGAGSFGLDSPVDGAVALPP